MSILDLEHPAMKLLLGEEITEDEKTQLREEQLRKELIKFLYIQKVSHDSPDNKILNMSFTFGPDWMSVPIVDIVNNLLEMKAKVDSGEWKPLDFNDYCLKKSYETNPPKTGLEKREL